MSDDAPTGGGGGGEGGGEGPSGRRRRRRRRGGAAGDGAGPAAVGGDQGGDQGGERAPRAAAGSEAERTAEGGRRRRTRRRRGGGEGGGEGDGQGAESGAAPTAERAPRPPQAAGADGDAQGTGEDATGRRKRRRRGRDTQEARGDGAAAGGGRGEPRTNRREGRERPRQDAARPRPADAGAVDEGWDLEAPAAERLGRPSAESGAPSAAGFADGDDELVAASGADITPDEDDDPSAPAVVLSADLPDDAPAIDPDRGSALDGDTALDLETREVKNVCGVRFAASGRVYSFDAGSSFYDLGSQVVVEAERGTRLGTVAVAPRRMTDTSRSLKKILRTPRREDLAEFERGEAEGLEALATARRLAREVRLAGKVFKVEASSKRWLIHVTSEERLDTREFARRLASEARGRVEIRQTGVRDEARSIGGIGSCGRELCCTTWLPEFVPVSIKMAKDQGLVLNPTKVSGQCGRLKCCLVYEQDLYAEMRKGLPKLGKRVVTESGEGRVVEVDVLRQRIRVSLGPGQFEVFPASEVKPLFPSQQTSPKPKQ